MKQLSTASGRRNNPLKGSQSRPRLGWHSNATGTVPDKASGTVIRIPDEQRGGIAASLEHLGSDLRSAISLRDSRKKARPRPFCSAVGTCYLLGAPSYSCTLYRSSGSSPPASHGSLSLSQRAVSSRCQGCSSFASLAKELQGWPISTWTGLSAPSDYLEHQMPQRWLKKGTAKHLRHRSQHLSSLF